MFERVAVPVWALALLILFAAVTFASHFLVPSVRWFFRRRAEALVSRLNLRLARPIEPFKLARRLDTIERLAHDPEVARAIVEHARSNGVPESVAYETARRYAREIVPGFSALLYFGVAARLAMWLSRSLYRVRVSGQAEAMAAIRGDAPVVFVLNHRSNMDYVLVTWLAARETALAYAVGEWARRWPLGSLIRAMGGYFVRRRDLNPLYRRVLARYVQIATANGVTQAVFPEGRLTRDGALQPPKLGILSYILADRDRGEAQEVIFVPVALNYDRVLEDRVLIGADGPRPGGMRLRWWMPVRYLARHLQLRLTRRFARFGYAAVAYGRPLSLGAFLAEGHADPAAALAGELMARIDAALPVLPMALACEALVSGARTTDAVADRIAAGAEEWRARGHVVHLGRRPVGAIASDALGMLVARGVVAVSDRRVAVPPEGQPLLRFYASSLPRRRQGAAPAAAEGAERIAVPNRPANGALMPIKY